MSYESITIGESGQLTYYSDEALNLKSVTSLKAYIATGYDKTSGTIWLSRIYDVPANTGILLIGDEGTYHIPVKANGSMSYCKNLFKGTLGKMTLQAVDGDYTNYYLSNGDYGVGFYKVTAANGIELSANRAYLSVPTDIPAVGTAGSSETISVGTAGQVPYYSANSLDFTSMEELGVKAYTATIYDYGTGTIWLSRVKKVPAETGVLIITPEGDYAVPTASVASVYANMFKGSLTASTIYTTETIDDVECTNYYLSDGTSGVGFYKVTNSDGVDLNASTRSMSVEQPELSPLQSDDVIAIRLFNSSNGTTGIDVQSSMFNLQSDNVYYNLQGQRVKTPAKGVYIHHGKKIMIK